MEQKKISYIVYTGAVKDGTVGDYTALHLRAMRLGIPCLTSTDTANALADIIASRFTLKNTELVDINAMRTERVRIGFAKMQSCGNDYIFIENFDDRITCPESLCVELCTHHYGIGGDGIVLIGNSKVADASMRTFNKDGSEGLMAGNNIRCVGKYLYDKGIVKKETMTVETAGGIHTLRLFLRDGKVGSVAVDMGKAVFDTAAIPVKTEHPVMINVPAVIGGREYRITCVSVGNPHCVVFCDSIDGIDLETVGPAFENDPLFPRSKAFFR